MVLFAIVFIAFYFQAVAQDQDCKIEEFYENPTNILTLTHLSVFV